MFAPFNNYFSDITENDAKLLTDADGEKNRNPSCKTKHDLKE